MRVGILVAAAVLALVGAQAPLASTTTTITFDDVPSGTDVQTHYANVSFSGGCENNNKPHAVAFADAHSPPNVEQTGCSEVSPGLLADFASGQASVSLWARISTQTPTYQLDAYAADGTTLIGSDTHQIDSTGWVQFTVAAPGGAETIRHVALRHNGSQALSLLYVDDFTYAGTPPPPDTIPPLAWIDQPKNDAIVWNDPSGSQIPTFTGKFYDAGGISSWCAAEGNVEPVPCANHVTGAGPYYEAVTSLQNVTSMNEGDHRLHIWAHDFAGHEGEGISTIHIRNRPNLFVRGVELTQEISRPFTFQNERPFANETLPWGATRLLPLVANKPTLLRIYLGKSGTTFDYGASAEVVASRAGVQLPGTATLATAGSTSGADPFAIQRVAGATLNTVLPPSWTNGSGPVDLNVTIAPPTGVPECTGCSPQGNELTVAAVPFDHPRELVIRPVRLKVTIRDTRQTFAPTEDARLRNWDDFARIYPLTRSDVSVDAWRGTATRVYDYRSEVDCQDLLGSLDLFRAFDNQSGIYVGYFPHTLGLIGCSGMAWIGGQSAIVKDITSVVLEAHELGHNAGFSHDPCGPDGPRECDPNYFVPHGGLGGVGYDLSTAPFTLIDPGDPAGHPDQPHGHDLMAGGLQFSVPHWLRLLKWIGTSASSFHDARAEARPYRDAIVVAGSFSRKRAKITDVVHAPAGLNAPAGEASAVTLVLEDRTGKALERFPLSTEVADLPPGSPTPFVVAMPAKRGAASIVVERGARALARHTRSAHAPVVRWRQVPRAVRRGRVLIVRWEARDADGGRLRFSVFYRVGHARWRPLVVEQAQRRFRIPALALPRSRTLRLRLAASDGFNTSFAITKTITSR